MSCVKIIALSIVLRRGPNTLTFYVFEYGAECGAESGAR